MARNYYLVPRDYYDEILEELAEGKTWADIAHNRFRDAAVLRKEVYGHPDLREALRAALELRAHATLDRIEQTVEEAMGCTDKVQIQAYKLKVETLKWQAAKFFPKVYGDRQVLEHEGTVGTMSNAKLDSRLQSLLLKAGVKVLQPAQDPPAEGSAGD